MSARLTEVQVSVVGSRVTPMLCNIGPQKDLKGSVPFIRKNQVVRPVESSAESQLVVKVASHQLRPISDNAL